ncbi:DUF3231 family protein [Bacillus sp. AK031]
MSDSNKVNLTSSEMASLWDAYISHTHTLCILKYFRAKAEDGEVLEILTHTYEALEKSKNECEALLQSENIPVPMGFGENDVDISAPRLFSDTFAMMYLKNLATVMMASCILMFTVSTRKDIR